MVEKAITNHKEKNKIDAINETEKPQASKSKNINLSAMNQTKLWDWINQVHCTNQGLFKELKQKTQ